MSSDHSPGSRSEPGQGQLWRDIVSHSALYALILSILLMVDDLLDLESVGNLGTIPHPLVYFVPIFAVIATVGLGSRRFGINEAVADRIGSPVAVYVVLCLVVGSVWIAL